MPMVAAWARPNPQNPRQKRLPIAAGAVQVQLAAVYDLFPTVLGVAGIDPPRGHVIDGEKLDLLFTGRRDTARDEVFLMHYPHAPHRGDYFTCFRKGSWKVIYHYFPGPASGDSHYQLFDLANDPFEQNDLAASRPKVLRRMMQGLIDALEKHNALYPTGKDGVTPLKPELPPG